jgi:CubicO group peptidase (beta-lactamase class C family)
MGIVILHKGKIVFEEYPRMEPYEKPIYWSVTKVFVSTVLAILEDRGLVDVSRPIDYYLPALGESDYAGVMQEGNSQWVCSHPQDHDLQEWLRRWKQRPS